MGNTEYVARLIQKTVGGDLFRIETVDEYPLEHDLLVDQAAEEQDANFLEEYDFGAKTIIPFITHGGSGASRTADTISQLQPGGGAYGNITGGDMELSSFVSEKNENIKSVQFVIQTESIHLAKVEATIEEAPENLNFFQKFLKLFGLYD